jgi:hypothetical protein
LRCLIKLGSRLLVDLTLLQIRRDFGLQDLKVLGNIKEHDLGADIPNSGLHQDMLNDSILLKDIDILCAAGNQHDEIQCQISRFFITKAIREVYPAAVDHVFDLKRTDMELDNSPG